MGCRRSTVGLALAAALLLTACGLGGSGEPAAGTPTAAPTAPLPADQLVFTVRTSGGFVPQLVIALESPELLVYGDGRVLEADDADSAPPYVPRAYEVGRVHPQTVARFAAEAEATALFEPGVDFGTPSVSDLPFTTVVLQGAGGRRSVTVYAFGTDFTRGLDRTQKAARQALRDLIGRGTDLRPADGSSPFQPDRVRVAELELTDPTASGPTWPGPDPQQFWATGPKSTPWTACGSLQGTPAADLYRAARANPGAVWRVDGTARVLAVVPELTADEGCPR